MSARWPVLFVVRKGDGLWHWTLKAGNGHAIARSASGFPSPRNAQESFDRVLAVAEEAIDVQVYPW